MRYLLSHLTESVSVSKASLIAAMKEEIATVRFLRSKEL